VTIQAKSADGRRPLLLPAIISALLLVVATPATAQEQSDEPAHEEGHFLKHELSFNLASTYETRAASVLPRNSEPAGSNHNNLTLGAGYAFRLHPIFGVGATVEYITHERNWLFVFPAYFHVYRGLKLVAGPGFERKHEHATTEFLARLAAMYSFEVAHRYSITPVVALDLIGRESAVVVGVEFGIGF